MGFDRRMCASVFNIVFQKRFITCKDAAQMRVVAVYPLNAFA